ncbi:acyltransferase [Enterobacter hormaechei]|nr:acyltransferase [Enterobacter hormaechei]
MNNRIQSIHFLRGIAAVCVVLYHFKGYLNDVYAQKDLGQILFGSGAFGVDLFFMISGFIIALSSQKVTPNLVFAIRRFFRIYPAFIVIFLIGVVFVYRFDPNENILRGMFFIHRDYSIESPGFGYNVLGPAWTLTYEIYFYTVFAISMSLSHRFRTLIASIMLASSVFIIQYYYDGSISVSGLASASVPHDSYAFGILRFMSSPIILEFVVGMAFYELFRNMKLKVTSGMATFIFFSTIGISLTNYFTGYFTGFGLDKAGAFSIILLFGFLTYDKYVGFKENKTLSFLGDVSFSVYISHYLFINLMNFYRPDFYVDSNGIGRLSMMLTITFIAGTALHYCIERPFIKVGKLIEKRVTEAIPSKRRMA